MSALTALERDRYFFDVDGVRSTTKDESETILFSLDWSDRLGVETIASVTWTDDGVVSTARANTATTTSARITGIGELKVKVTTSGSQVLLERIRFYEVDGARRADYG